MPLLTKPVTDVVYSSMPSEDPRDMFQSAKHSCILASASSDHFHIELSHWYFLLKFVLVSRNQEDRVMVRFAKWRVGGALYASLCGVKVV